MRVTVDTNILVRIAVNDDPRQAEQALRLLQRAATIVITVPALCEFVWAVRRGYRRQTVEIAAAIRQLIGVPSVQVDRSAVEAGLAMLEAGGDFADGVTAFEGRRLGGPVFASFDRAAIRLVAATGGETHLLGTQEDSQGR